MEHIWNFQTNEAVETDKIELKSFKPTGKFFEDVASLVKHFNVRCHPALKESAYNEGEGSHKDVTTLNFFKYRLDRNSMRITFLCLPPAQHIQTLKFSNNGLTVA
jgi:hypothetical protein